MKSFGTLNILFVLHLCFIRCNLVKKISNFSKICTEICFHTLKGESGYQVLIMELGISDMFLKSLMESGKSVVEVKQILNGLIPVNYYSDDLTLNRSIMIVKGYSHNFTLRVQPRKCPSRVEHFDKTLSKISQTNREVCSCSLCLHDNTTYCNCSLLSELNYTIPMKENSISKTSVKRSRKWPDMMGKMIEAVTFHRPISTIINKNESDPAKRYDGLEMNIFIEIAKKLNMTWRINELDGEMDKWGQLLSNGTWKGGIMEQLTSGTAEIGFSTLWMSPYQIPYLDYTTSWTSISSKFLVPRPTVIGISWESLVKPFTLPVWSVVVLCLLLFPASVWVMIHLHLLFTRDQQLSAKTNPIDVASYVLYTLGSITGGSGVLSKRQEPPLRILVSCWYIFILLICNSYTSKIMACLTLPSYTTKIDYGQQLIDQQFSWGLPYQENTLFKQLDLDQHWQREFTKSYMVYKKSNLKELLLSKRFTVVVQKMESCDYLFMDDPIDEDIADNFRVMKEDIKNYRCAIGFRKHSPLLPAFDEVLKRFIETGLVKHFKEDAERRFQKPAYKRVLFDLDNGIQSKEIAAFTLKNYNFMIYFYFFGMLISIICFILELCSKQIIGFLY